MNLILTILLVSSIIDFFKKPSYTTLNCGIWGFNSDEKLSKFNWTKFNWIGALNDARGGDACGRVCGTLVEHSNQIGEKKYLDYIKKYNHPTIKKGTKMIMGHSRKTSFIYKETDGIQYTQPVFYPIDNRETPNNNKIIGVHNGTLHNYKELAKKYKVPFDDFPYWGEGNSFNKHQFNDSQTLLYIVGILKQYDVLKEYYGSAAFAIYDFASNELMLWSGASLAYSYSTKHSNERPLYYIQGNNYVWFSSLKDSLENINDDKDTFVSEVEENTLMFFKNGVFKESIKIDRSDKYQYDYTPPKVHNFDNKHDNKAKGGKYKRCQNCNGSGNLYGGIKCPVCLGDGYILATEPVQFNLALMAQNDNKSEVDREILPKKDSRLVRFVRGRFYFQEKLAHGILHLNTYGYRTIDPILDIETEEDWEITKPYYFVFGIMLENHEKYQKWVRAIKNINGITMKNAKLIAQDSKLPIYLQDLCFMVAKQQDYGKDTIKPYTGKFVPLFGNNEYEFKNGLFVNKTHSTSADPIENFPNHGVAKQFAIEQIDDKGLSYDNQFDSDDTTNEMVKKELARAVGDVLIAIDDAYSDLFVLSDHKKVSELDLILQECKNTINNFSKDLY